MYSLVTLRDEIVILRDSEVCFSLVRGDMSFALRLYRNLVDGPDNV